MTRWGIAVAALAGVAVGASFQAAKIDAVVEKSRKAWSAPGVAVAVIKDDRVILARGYGVKELGKPDSVTADSIFAIGSTTKAFTTAAIAMLVDEGKMGWDDPVRRHVESFRLSDPLANELVTVRDLISHRTGLSRHDELWYGAPWSREEIIRRIGFVPLSKPFRSAWQYQNIMFLVAGYALGRASGGGWDDFVQKRIFDPLGMSNANTSTLIAEKAPDRATPHAKLSSKLKSISWRNLDDIGPAGSINASVNDVAKWVRFQLAGGLWNGKRLISEKNFAELHTPQMAMRPEDFGRNWNPETNQISYGLGWFIGDYRGLHLIHHGGAIDGFRANITLVPKERLGIVVLCNLGNDNFPEALRWELIDTVLGLPEHDWDAALLEHFGKIEADARGETRKFLAGQIKGTKPSRKLEDYAGEYEDAGYGVLKLSSDGKLLRLEWRGQAGRLEHFHYDTFLTEARQPVVFHLAADGRIQSLGMFGTEFRRK